MEPKLIIDDERVEKAIAHLVSTDARLGALKGHIEGLKHTIKATLAVQSLKAKGSSATECKMIAEATPEYAEKIEELENAIIEFETISARRKTAELMVEVWRTQQANRRRGNI